MDNFQLIATFVRIADAGSISRAARSLGLSVAMASRHLRALEADLGVELMRRTTRRLDLTPAGETYLERSRALLSDLQAARDAVRPGKAAAGLVVMSLPVSFGLGQVVPLLPGLLAKHPRLQLDVRFEDRLVDLLGDSTDIAIRAGTAPPDSPFVMARKLTSFERVLCASPAYVNRAGAIEEVSALSRAACIVQGAGPTEWQFDTAAGPESVAVEGRLRSNNVLAIRQAAVDGLGIAQLPLWLVTGDLRDGRLVRVLEGATAKSAQVVGLFHRGSRGSSTIRAVLDFLAVELPRTRPISTFPPGDARKV